MVNYRLVAIALLAITTLVSPLELRAATKKKKPVARQTATRSATVKAVGVRQRQPKGKPVLRKANYTPAARGPNSRYRVRQNPYVGFWTVPNFADSTEGDVIDGEDLEVRRAAVEALNGLNGSVVVADANTGRILTIVNQKLALQNGFQPCSTVKILTSVAGVMEGQYNARKVQKLGREYMDMTAALARSNNPYFANIGRKLGYEKISYYAQLLGFGEKAGLNIPGEQPGAWPDKEVASGIGMMTSFGDGIQLTPLQLTSMLAAIANGGTMFYLQYPKNQAEAEAFQPQVKRRLTQLAPAFAEIRPGMQGAIEFGTARRAAYEEHEPIFGKTGTCTHSDHRTHLGWFGSFNEIGDRKLVVTVLLTGGKLVNGPVASGVAGSVFKKLNEKQYFASNPQFVPVHAELETVFADRFAPQN
jgi:cell division protein FtsI/penicillin-binding protein 2